MNSKVKFTLALFLFYCSVTMASGLKGTYTIDGTKSASASNYTSFNDAVSDLLYGSRLGGAATNGPGVTGAVIFSVADGTYKEQLEITAIIGVSASNTVSFISASRDSSKVILTDSTPGTAKTLGYVLHLDGVSFVNFKYITLMRGKSSSPSSYDDEVIIVDNVCDSDSITHCQLIGDYISTTGYGGALVYSSRTSPFAPPSSNDNYMVFTNNYFKKSYYCFNWEGNSGAASGEKGNVWDHNVIDSIGYYGLLLSYQEGITITNNKINMPWGYYCVFLSSINVSAKSNTSVIANNFLSVAKNISSGNNAGFYLGSLDKTNIVYNNVNIYGAAGASSYGAYINGSSSAKALNIYNNNFYNQNKGSADYALYGNNFTAEDYNNLKTAGTAFVNYGGTDYKKLTSWISSGKGFAKHDTAVNPVYNSNTDLHVSNHFINGRAKVLSYDTTDIDGDKRDPKTPDIGADEFVSIAVNPEIKAVVKPDSGFCTGTHDVYVLLNNRGYDTLKSLKIVWSVNGVAQTPFYWTGTLAPTSVDSIDIGSYNFSSGSTLYKTVIFPDSANGISISRTKTNFDSTILKTGLVGAYSIDNTGKTTPDYTSFRAAVFDLNTRGVCGAVTFNAADSSYTESIMINHIAGASATNSIVFQSASGDSSKVVIDTSNYGPWAYRGYVISLNGANYVTFKKISVINRCNNGYGYEDAVEITNCANHVAFENCFLKVSSSFTNPGYVVNDVFGSVENYITLKNNYISGGYCGIELEGVYTNYTTVAERGNLIYHNTIDSAWGYGIISHYNDSMTISRNRIVLSTINYAMYIYGTSTTNTDTTVIANNFIRLVGHTGTGLLVNYCFPLVVAYNSIVTTANSYPTAVLYSNGKVSGVKTYDNIFMNLGAGTVISGNSTGMGTSDNNDFYTTGSVLGLWNSTTNCSGLSDWQKTTSLDAKSISVNPDFRSVTNGDLHLTSASVKVMQKGIPLTIVNEDYDGEPRNKIPNMGADETRLIALDAAAISIDSPTVDFCSGTKNVYATIYNAGLDTIKSVNVNWSVDGISMTTYSWSGILTAHNSAQVKLGSVIYKSHNIKTIKVWTSSPNGSADSNAVNDTVYNATGSGMSGVYTIGGAAPDFAGFNIAMAALYKYGVCGATTFNVRDGNYNESVVIKKVNGASNANWITFQSESYDSTKVTIDTAWNGGTYYNDRSVALRFDGAQYVSFKKMSVEIISGEDFTYADAVELAGGAAHDSLSGNIFYTYPYSILSFGSNIYDDMNTVESHNTIYNNVIAGGLNALSLLGYSGGAEKGNIIDHNLVDSVYADGVVCTYQDSLVVRNNVINLGLVNYGLYLANCPGSDTSIVENNFITLSGVAGIGLFSKDNSLLNVYNNSVVNSSDNLGFATGYFTGTTSNKVNVVDNIFYNEINGAAIYGDNYGISKSDYNDIYSAGTTVDANWNGTWYSLADWQKLSKFDKHSLSGDPGFYDVSSGDLHLTAASIYARHKGIHLASVKNDIDKQARKNINPDMGADEVPQDSNDVGVEAIVNPVNLSCGSSNSVVAVKIANYGISDQNSNFNVHVNIKGASVNAASYAFSGILKGSPGLKVLHDTIVYVSFKTPWNTSGGGRYIITAYTDLVTDGDNSNDTITISDSFVATPTAGFVLNSSTLCAGDTLTVSDKSTGGKTYRYFVINDLNVHVDSSGSANPSFVIKTAGKYKVLQLLINASGCADTISNTFGVDTVNSHFIFSTPLKNGTVKFSAADPGLKSYNWNFGDGSIDSIASPGHQYLATGWFHIQLRVHDTYGCSSSTTDSLNILFTGIFGENANDFAVKVYPDPVIENAFVSYSLPSLQKVVFEIYDLNGHLIASKNAGMQDEGNYTITLTGSDFKNASQGTYILKCNFGDKIYSRFIILCK